MGRKRSFRRTRPREGGKGPAPGGAGPGGSDRWRIGAGTAGAADRGSRTTTTRSSRASASASVAREEASPPAQRALQR
ncbi:hypothetical protein C0Q63_22545 [Streptomyces albidoflavus]|nr:hypothetical protein C0Q63_22545 [Streptomyces albidoflavus]